MELLHYRIKICKVSDTAEIGNSYASNIHMKSPISHDHIGHLEFQHVYLRTDLVFTQLERQPEVYATKSVSLEARMFLMGVRVPLLSSANDSSDVALESPSSPCTGR